MVPSHCDFCYRNGCLYPYVFSTPTVVLIQFILCYLVFQIKGKVCGICKNSENETLHVRNICFDWSRDDVSFLAYLI
jgi:hypothetical protein